MRVTKLFFACAMSVTVVTIHAIDNSSQETDTALDAIAQINHINWGVTKIKHYNNAIVLEEEYEKISPRHAQS